MNYIFLYKDKIKLLIKNLEKTTTNTVTIKRGATGRVLINSHQFLGFQDYKETYNKLDVINFLNKTLTIINRVNTKVTGHFSNDFVTTDRFNEFVGSLKPIHKEFNDLPYKLQSQHKNIIKGIIDNISHNSVYYAFNNYIIPKVRIFNCKFKDEYLQGFNTYFKYITGLEPNINFLKTTLFLEQLVIKCYKALTIIKFFKDASPSYILKECEELINKITSPDTAHKMTLSEFVQLYTPNILGGTLNNFKKFSAFGYVEFTTNSHYLLFKRAPNNPFTLRN